MRRTSPQPNSAPAHRIAALAALPLFMTLAGNRAIVAGGTPAAAWKAELLAASGARVTVLASSADRSDEMAALAERGAAAGSLDLHDAEWSPADLAGSALAVADCADADEAKRFVAACRAAGVPVNVIDKPAFCDFRFGSVVNRSPVVIGISTNGAAPILGQAIRRRIEAVLPATLGGWGRLAASVRAHVTAALPPGAARRAFWERFVDRAFGGGDAPVSRGALNGLIARARTDAERHRGRLSLVPIASDAADLLTLRAVRVLQSADVVVHGAWVPPAILELARREAERVSLGALEEARAFGIARGHALSGRHVVWLGAGEGPAEAFAALAGCGVALERVPAVDARGVCDVGGTETRPAIPA